MSAVEADVPEAMEGTIEGGRTDWDEAVLYRSIDIADMPFVMSVS